MLLTIKNDENVFYPRILCSIVWFQVRNTNNDQTYHTDVTIGLCSCREGECGKLCKHLLVALQECDLIRRSKILLNEYGKRKSFQIVTGKESDE